MRTFPISYLVNDTKNTFTQKIKSRLKKINCIHHGPITRIDVLVKGQWILGNCPECDKIDFALKAKKNRVAAVNLANLTILKESGIPERYQGKDFDDFKAGTNKNKQRILNICKNYSNNFDQAAANGIGMIMLGLTGTGKTLLACAICSKLIRNGKNVLFTGTYRTIQIIKETFNNIRSATEREIIDSYVDLDLLVLDEAGNQYGSFSEQLLLFEIINRRYEALKATIFISNLELTALQHYVGERILDRMQEGGGAVLAFDWPSERR